MNNSIIKLVLSILIFNLSFISATSYAEEKIPLSEYGTLPKTSMMKMSPSGKYVAFRQITNDRDMYLVYSLAENKIIRSIDISATKPTKAYFISDEQIILVAGKYQQTFGFYGTGPEHTSYALGFNIAKNKLYRLLTPGNGIYDNQWGLGYITAMASEKDFIYMPAWVGGHGGGFDYSLMQTRLTSKRKPRIKAHGTEHTYHFIMNANDEVLARQEYDNKTNEYKIQAYKNKEWITIYQTSTSGKPVKIKGLSPDGKNLIISRYENNYLSYFSMSLVDGEISETPLFSRDDVDVETVIKDINQVIYGVKYSGFLPSYKFFDDKITQRLNTISKSFANTAIHLKDWSDDWKNLLVYIEGQESSGEYIIVNEKNEMNIIGAARPLIPYTKVHPTTTFYYNAADGLKIPALMTFPRHWDKKSPLPTIMVPHGGPESYNPIEFNWMTQYFAEQGYLVVQPQFRGSNGFGRSFKNKGRGEWGKKMQTDLNDALAALVNKGMVDPDHTCIVGGSYGGYAALAAGAFTPELYKCIVSINGLADISLFYNSKKQKFGKDHWVVNYWRKIILNKETKEELFNEISPITHVKAFKAPVLLIHAENDHTVNIEQSENMHDALLSAGKKSIFIELERDDHYMSYSKTRLQALTEISKFVKKHI